MKTLSINVDMGAKNNGVFIALLDEAKLLKTDAFNVKFEKNSINFSKLDRTARRHTRRSYDRKRFIPRLLGEILPLSTLSKSEEESLYGLFKNRGFNYIDIDESGEISQDDMEILNKTKDYYFKECQTAEAITKQLNKKIDELLESNDFLDELMKFADTQLKILDELKDKLSKNSKSKTLLTQIFNKLKKELYNNNKHRINYLKDIKTEIDESFKDTIPKLKIFKNSDEFYNFVGNISNLQTRVLRRYFNEKPNSSFDDTRLRKNLLRNIRYMSYLSDKEKANKTLILENLSKFNALDFLKLTNPETTIPPYENHKNKNPMKCNALLIKSNKITPTLKSATKKILNHIEFSSLQINEYGEFIELTEYNIAKFLQRILDISKGFLLDTSLYPRTLELKDNATIFAREIGLSSDELREFRKFSTKYYTELKRARKGYYDYTTTKDETLLLKVCACNTPHKNKNKDSLISALFGKKFTITEVESLKDFLRNNKIVKNSTYKSFFERLSKCKKSYQNAFYHKLEAEYQKFINKQKLDDKDLEQIFKNYEKVIDNIESHNENLSFKRPLDASNLATNFNYLSQLGDIIFDEKNRGFLKTCRSCSLENTIRSGGQKAMASRLSANPSKLINGKIEMYLERLAHEIKEQIPTKILNDIDDIQINVEMNRFSFEENIASLNLSKKREQKVFEFFCPYTGSKISEQNCEYDHILPRSKGLYNSLANLIPASTKGNQDKGNTRKLLSELHDNYLNSIYKQTSTNASNFKDFIDKYMDKIDPSKFTNFLNLSLYEQVAFRHALFLESSEKSFKKALELLKIDTIKTHSNGTQKRFSNILLSKFEGISKSQSIEFINSKLVSSTRCELSRINPNISKAKIQDSHSHCIDASVVFHCANSSTKNGKIEFNFDYFNDIYPQDSVTILPQAKKYLELISEGKSPKSKRLFDDSVYSLVYESTHTLKDKEFSLLLSLGLLHTKQNGKNTPLTPNSPKPRKFYITTHKVFELLFKAFKENDTELLESLKFLDGHLKSYIRKDIFDIFFDKNGLKKPKSSTKNIDKFYDILKENEAEIFTSKTDEKGKISKTVNQETIKTLFKNEFHKNSQPRKRGKNRVTFSLPTPSKDAKYLIRRNGGFAGLKNASIATQTYCDIVNMEILKVPFFSKNVIPIKISEILELIKLKNTKARQIYKLPITKDLPNGIISLNFTVSQAGRHNVLVSFDKAKLKGLNLQDKEGEKEFIDSYLNGKFKEFLGKPRDLKFDIIKNSDDILTIKYGVKSTSVANKKVMINELK